jgi:hypothetical protein
MEDIKYPLWVRLGIWGSSSRGMMTFLFWGAVILALGNAAYIIIAIVKEEASSMGEPFFWSVFFTLAAAHYFLCRRWVDKHSDWLVVRHHWIEGWKIILGIILVILAGFIAGFVKANLAL